MDLDSLNVSVYQSSPQIVLGFHGCEKKVALDILNSGVQHLTPSNNDYDWLGTGIYFWLNDPKRALEWAQESDKIKEPSVIGAVINLGSCLNFAEREAIQLLRDSYDDLKSVLAASDTKLVNVKPDDGGFKLVRRLDCAVINNLHTMIAKNKGIPFDSVYGYFQESSEVYPNAGIRSKSHIQICVRNTECIKGYFLPRMLTES